MQGSYWVCLLLKPELHCTLKTPWIGSAGLNVLLILFLSRAWQLRMSYGPFILPGPCTLERNSFPKYIPGHFPPTTKNRRTGPFYCKGSRIRTLTLRATETIMGKVVTLDENWVLEGGKNVICTRSFSVLQTTVPERKGGKKCTP